MNNLRHFTFFVYVKKNPLFHTNLGRNIKNNVRITTIPPPRLDTAHDDLNLSLIQTLSDASAADCFLKTQCQKKKLLKTSNFSFCHNVFHFQSQVIHSILEIFYFLTKYVQSRLLQNCRMVNKLLKCYFLTYWQVTHV